MTPRINTLDYVRPTTAARLAGLSVPRIKQLMLEGSLPFVVIDDHRFIRRADAERLRAEREGRT